MHFRRGLCAVLNGVEVSSRVRGAAVEGISYAALQNEFSIERIQLHGTAAADMIQH